MAVRAQCHKRINTTTNGHVIKVVVDGVTLERVMQAIMSIVMDGVGGVGIIFILQAHHITCGHGGDGVMVDAGGVLFVLRSIEIQQIIVGIYFGQVGHGGVHVRISCGVVNLDIKFVVVKQIVA